MLASHLSITTKQINSMKKILTNYRYYVLAIVLIVAILGIFSVPTDDQPAISWVYCLVSSKLIGFAFGWIAVKLIKRWERMGAIPELIDAVTNF